MNIVKFSRLLQERRGEKGVREFARELGISPATLSRVESGKLPDLETFAKLCTALRIDPSEILEVRKIHKVAIAAPSAGTAAVHYRSDAQYSIEAAQDLAALILAAQEFANQTT
ncbi:MAG: helix-turn-helix domain-containing protein [Terracidiphilus sp.]